ncbi:hypothetical protein R1flu_000420 [Riccia fluitans]|uniref:30-kDa cleavage and polyadenylation specificity factor 30 n=1 Tax=Riccia fluitans TaxID=41844 RepID=A0ABD1Y0F4_9MARC
MEDEGGLSFDFEGGLDAAAALQGPSAPQQGAAVPANNVAHINSSVPGGGNAGSAKVTPGRKNYRQTVCRHWLRGLCMKGDACGFLHQYDKARMPVCRFFAKFGECREPDCIYKHTNEDIKECNMYKLGFCPNGPDCRYRHQKMQGPPPSVEQNLQKIQHRIYAINGGTHHGKYPPTRQGHGEGQGQGQGQSQGEGQAWRPPAATAPARPVGQLAVTDDSQNVQHSQVQRPSPQPQPATLPPPPPVVPPFPVANGSPNPPPFTSAAIPLPPGFCRFFIVKSSNRENLELSVERGLWATHRNNESKLNEAFDTCDHVILIFSVNETRHFQGCARMMSKIGVVAGGGGWKYAHGTAHYGRNFRLKWFKLCELSFNKTRHLRNPFNENLPVKISRDCQELERGVGEQLVQLLYMEPDSELMEAAKQARAKREEEKARVGPAAGPDVDEADIIPFEENEDEQEEEDSDDDDGSSQTVTGNAGRGRGLMGPGHMWNPYGMGRGGRGGMGGGPGGRGMGFHPEMGAGFGMGNFDRFPGMGPGDGFGMGPGEMFGGHPGGPGRGFPPFPLPGPGFGGPEFPNMGPGFGPMDGPGPGPGMVFHGRPPPPNGMFPPDGPGMMGPPPGGPGPGMMMGGGGRPPHFMGGPPVGPMGGGRPPRPMGPGFRPPFAGAPGGRGGRGPGDQPKRRRADRSSGNDRGTTSEDGKAPGKLRTGSSGDDAVQANSEAEFAGAGQRHQGEDGSGYGSAAYAGDNEEDESESEDEAPRRSRHGEGKKKRRDWDEDGNGGGSERWEQGGEQGGQWEVATTV